MSILMGTKLFNNNVYLAVLKSSHMVLAKDAGIHARRLLSSSSEITSGHQSLLAQNVPLIRVVSVA